MICHAARHLCNGKGSIVSFKPIGKGPVRQAVEILARALYEVTKETPID